ncbi:hypothetical protein D1BOALGB6SA_9679 [Olavius sp. associated proteobacterium Delta 1]|nr:hypothetical protein D1BOALGB6SA_9679 [Olavius sp. associated proteobacterium Delta 1]
MHDTKSNLTAEAQRAQSPPEADFLAVERTARKKLSPFGNLAKTNRTNYRCKGPYGRLFLICRPLNGKSKEKISLRTLR